MTDEPSETAVNPQTEPEQSAYMNEDRIHVVGKLTLLC